MSLSLLALYSDDGEDEEQIEVEKENQKKIIFESEQKKVFSAADDATILTDSAEEIESNLKDTGECKVQENMASADSNVSEKRESGSFQHPEAQYDDKNEQKVAEADEMADAGEPQSCNLDKGKELDLPVPSENIVLESVNNRYFSSSHDAVQTPTQLDSKMKETGATDVEVSATCAEFPVTEPSLETSQHPQDEADKLNEIDNDLNRPDQAILLTAAEENKKYKTTSTSDSSEYEDALEEIDAESIAAQLDSLFSGVMELDLEEIASRLPVDFEEWENAKEQTRVEKEKESQNVDENPTVPDETQTNNSPQMEKYEQDNSSNATAEVSCNSPESEGDVEIDNYEEVKQTAKYDNADFDLFSFVSVKLELTEDLNTCAGSASSQIVEKNMMDAEASHSSKNDRANPEVDSPMPILHKETKIDSENAENSDEAAVFNCPVLDLPDIVRELHGLPKKTKRDKNSQHQMNENDFDDDDRSGTIGEDEDIDDLSDSDELQCNICFMPFRSVYRLKLHRLVHTAVKPHKCSECDKGYIAKALLQTHMVRKHGHDRKTKAVDKESDQLKNFYKRRKKHKKRITSETFKITKVKNNGKSCKEANNGNGRTSGSTTPKGRGQDNQERRETISSAAPEEKTEMVKSSLTLFCKLCSEKFSDHLKLDAHVIDHCITERKRKPIKRVTFADFAVQDDKDNETMLHTKIPTQKTLNEKDFFNLPSFHPNFTQLVGLALNNEGKFPGATKEMAEEKDGGVYPVVLFPNGYKFVCPCCFICFQERISMIKHLSKHMNYLPKTYAEQKEIRPLSILSSSNNRKRKLANPLIEEVLKKQCLVALNRCDNLYYGSAKIHSADNNPIENPEKIIQGETEEITNESTAKVIKLGSSKFKCSQCHKIFNYKRNAQCHLRSHNDEAKRFTCPLCQKTFTRSNSVKKHIKQMHMRKRLQKPYQCSKCDRCYNWEKNLRDHIKQSHPSKTE